MCDMIRQHVLPCCNDAGVGDRRAIQKGMERIEKSLKEVEEAEDEAAKATLARELRLDTMIKVREACDAAEKECPPAKWTLGTYENLLFLDTHEF